MQLIDTGFKCLMALHHHGKTNARSDYYYSVPAKHRAHEAVAQGIRIVTRFCTLHKSKNAWTCQNSTKTACDSLMSITRAILACLFFFLLAQCANQCDTNHIPLAFA